MKNFRKAIKCIESAGKALGAWKWAFKLMLFFYIFG